MKTLLLITSLLLSNLLANELTWVDEQIQAIKPPRDGVSSSKIALIQDPFIFLQTDEEAPKKKVFKKRRRSYSSKNSMKTNSQTVSRNTMSLKLEAIINNSALINGKWYKLNEKVGIYTLSRFTRTEVILTHNKKEFPLSTRSKNNSLKFKNN